MVPARELTGDTIKCSPIPNCGGVKPGARSYKLGDGSGLYLQVDPSGGRYWRFNYRINGKQKTLALGIYPDVSLAKARSRLQLAREHLADGDDPCIQKQAKGKIFEMVAREWHALPALHPA